MLGMGTKFAVDPSAETAAKTSSKEPDGRKTENGVNPIESIGGEDGSVKRISEIIGPAKVESTAIPVCTNANSKAALSTVLNSGFSLLKFSDYFQSLRYSQINFIRGIYVT
ncbi:hypothetical protein D1BOALGB6SA_3263 [Olavius sp. associated proteobacterium Delta 1]|nr:hypothetical protein D1BOALGB6SA_3263 [Olavius sp. associated proteobacterium Delta 1]